MQNNPHIRPLVGWILFCLLMFVTIAVFASRSSFDWLDRTGYNLLSSLSTSFTTDVMILFSTLGNGKVVAPIAACLVIAAVVLRRFAEALAVALLLLLGENLNDLLKDWFARPRPDGINLIDLPESYSFPSGHAMVSAPFYLLVGYLLHRLYGNRLLVRILLAAAIVTALLICLSRIYLGVHYTSDVLAGMFGGAAWLLIIIALYETVIRNFFSRSRKPSAPISVHRE
ncbi:phosphatase PAP2 family protein [Brevibacillus humidisoli]|uniref:phosphatase PAP2 family protein n=1 Tax=Brevibacillus humidisoli TaxID=2895522 RepID=UPI001E3348C5|nr:phosphatase PAP2 family protein [Brevibacillus humidisoli]UFJ42974.1 phosphatase PAP2 family protein [Brevibacillus humidisoli]